MKSLKIIDANVCGNKHAAAGLNYSGNARIFDLVCMHLVKENPDIIALHEITYESLGVISSRLSQCGYEMYLHKDFKAERRKASFTCLTVLFVRKDAVTFKQEYCGGFECQYRYIAGFLEIEEQKIFFRTNHVPCVDDESGRGSGAPGKQVNAQLRRKTDFLEQELKYQENLNERCAISMGDYNCALTGDFHAKDIFRKLPFTDLVDDPTWNGAVLDHIFISRALSESGIPIKHSLLSYPNLTDHKVLEMIINI